MEALINLKQCLNLSMITCFVNMSVAFSKVNFFKQQFTEETNSLILRNLTSTSLVLCQVNDTLTITMQLNSTLLNTQLFDQTCKPQGFLGSLSHCYISDSIIDSATRDQTIYFQQIGLPTIVNT